MQDKGPILLAVEVEINTKSLKEAVVVTINHMAAVVEIIRLLDQDQDKNIKPSKHPLF